MQLSPLVTSKGIEIIKDKLYWVSDRTTPKNLKHTYYFNIDKVLIYEPFYADFGPLDIGKTYRYIQELDKLLKDPKFEKCTFYHHTSTDEAKRANAAYLIGAYQVVKLNRTAEQAFQPFVGINPPFVDFRDASYTMCTYKCTILDCLRGLEYGIKLKWFDFDTFDIETYEHYEKVDNGDINWIVPGKLLAFSGPLAQNIDNDGYRRFTPEDYVPIFKKLGVNLVVRLNNKQYDKKKFTKGGINHLDLIYPDGSCPSDDIIKKFLNAVEQESGAVAVHCKAGLGRTGSLIAAYTMKHYKFPAADFIGWIRLCRPGSILGPQQQFLVNKESTFYKMGEDSSILASVRPLIREFWDRKLKINLDNNEDEDANNISIEYKNGDMSPLEKKVAELGDPGQASRLLDAKFKGKLPEFVETTSYEDLPSDDRLIVNELPDHSTMFRGGKTLFA